MDHFPYLSYMRQLQICIFAHASSAFRKSYVAMQRKPNLRPAFKMLVWLHDHHTQTTTNLYCQFYQLPCPQRDHIMHICVVQNILNISYVLPFSIHK